MYICSLFPDMRLLFSLVLLLLSIINTSPIFAQKYVMIKGQVWNLSGEELVGAHAYNITDRYGTFTNVDGIFMLVMNPGDSLKVTMIGYKPYRMRLPERLDSDNYKLDITLLSDTLLLRTAEIRPYPATYSELRREFAKLKVPDEKILERTYIPQLNYGSKYANPNGGGLVFPGPFTLLYNAFSREAKELRKMNDILEKNRLRDKFIETVTRRTLEKQFGVTKDEQIDSLMQACGITEHFLDANSDYDVINYLIACKRR